MLFMLLHMRRLSAAFLSSCRSKVCACDGVAVTARSEAPCTYDLACSVLI